MADQFQNSPLGNDAEQARRSHEPALRDRVQDLTWALLDERISDEELVALNQLLVSDVKARDAYIQCVQLHAELHAQFAPPRLQAAVTAPVKSPILGFLNSGIPPFEFQAPQAEDTAS